MSILIIKAIQSEIARFLLAVLFAVIFSGGSYYYYQSFNEERQIAENNLDKIKKKYAQAVESKKTVEEFKKRYEKLKSLEITDKENRLNWIDLIENTSRSEGIPYVKYKISQQEKSTDKKLSSKYSGIDVYQSKMQLEMHLLHEGDLYTLIRALDKQAKGLFDIHSCEIRRNKENKPSAINTGTNRNFMSMCILNWYTMKPKGV